MNIYEIESSYYDEGLADCSFDSRYLTHKDKYTEKEFYKICDKAYNQAKVKDIYHIQQILIDLYEFETIEPLYKYEFEEEE